MSARIVSFRLPPERLDEALTGIRAGGSALASQPGFRHAEWLYDRERALLTAVVVFESAEARAAAWEQLGPATEARWRAAGVQPELREVEVVHRV